MVSLGDFNFGNWVFIKLTTDKRMDTADKYTSLVFADIVIYIFAFCLAQHLANSVLLAVYIVLSIVLYLIFLAFIKDKELPFSIFLVILMIIKMGFLVYCHFYFSMG